MENTTLILTVLTLNQKNSLIFLKLKELGLLMLEVNLNTKKII